MPAPGRPGHRPLTDLTQADAALELTGPPGPDGEPRRNRPDPQLCGLEDERETGGAQTLTEVCSPSEAKRALSPGPSSAVLVQWNSPRYPLQATEQHRRRALTDCPRPVTSVPRTAGAEIATDQGFKSSPCLAQLWPSWRRQHSGLEDECETGGAPTQTEVRSPSGAERAHSRGFSFAVLVQRTSRASRPRRPSSAGGGLSQIAFFRRLRLLAREDAEIATDQD